MAVDRSGLITFIASVPSHIWVTVLTTAGADMTADIMRTCPSSVSMIPFPEVQLLSTHTTNKLMILYIFNVIYGREPILSFLCILSLRLTIITYQAIVCKN